LLSHIGDKTFHDQAGVDLGHGQMAEHRTGVGVERVCPLVGMLGVFPACLVRQDVRLGTLVESHHLGVGQRGGDLVLLLGQPKD
jgi:hypothetical protein